MTDLLPEREIVRRRIERESTVRGMLLGLALGDAIETGPRHGSSRWRGSATTQLACFVTEGLIRSSVRGAAKGICHPPEVMWHALARWSEKQRLGLPVAKRWRGGTDKHWPDGWLASVDALTETRGTAPATVRALTLGHGAAPIGPEHLNERPRSRGHHALTRSIALAALLDEPMESWARELASYSHDPETVPDVVETGLLLLRAALRSGDLQEWCRAVDAPVSDPARPVGAVMATPPKATPSGTAHRALLTAVRAVRAHDPRRDLADAIQAAAQDSGSGVIAGALLGALHGVERLPPTLWSLELGWVVDTLARDLVVQLDEPRSLDAGPVEDPRWWDRYPGW